MDSNLVLQLQAPVQQIAGFFLDYISRDEGLLHTVTMVMDCGDAGSSSIESLFVSEACSSSCVLGNASSPLCPVLDLAKA